MARMRAATCSPFLVPKVPPIITQSPLTNECGSALPRVHPALPPFAARVEPGGPPRAPFAARVKVVCRVGRALPRRFSFAARGAPIGPKLGPPATIRAAKLHPRGKAPPPDLQSTTTHAAKGARAQPARHRVAAPSRRG